MKKKKNLKYSDISDLKVLIAIEGKLHDVIINKDKKEYLFNILCDISEGVMEIPLEGISYRINE